MIVLTSKGFKLNHKISVLISTEIKNIFLGVPFRVLFEDVLFESFDLS